MLEGATRGLWSAGCRSPTAGAPAATGGLDLGEVISSVTGLYLWLGYRVSSDTQN